ncbi:protein kinase [Kitasatospora sp. NPDC088351]|uniref:protein kinase domain-containing protein n=1 Tax=unclassified Kitasatospora TaxID=2633591 RepID=UPI00343AD89A
MIGRALNGRYELVEILGVGGMATVWRGVDHVLGRQVAVKVLNGGLADDPRFAERFSREAQHAAMLVHPRIVMVFDSGVDQGSPYIVMELVHGYSLAALLAQQPGGMPVERAVGIAAAVCEALTVAHGAGLVHRDIKPGNIMITHDGGVKVVDFGIARAGSSSNLTQTATVLGTAAYLSPEQATASQLDGRTDLYAVGCVLTEMLTGAPPFMAETPVAIAFKHVSEQPLPPSALRPGLPSAVDGAVLRLLAKNPADRPAHAALARAELLATIPGLAVGDPTGELLAAAAAAQHTQVLPPVPAGFSDQQHTTFLPPQQAATSVMAAVPAQPPAVAPGAPVPAGPPVRESRRKPLLLGALGLAGVAGASVLALTAFDGPANDTTGNKVAHPVATSVTTPPPTPTPTPTPTVTTPPPTTPTTLPPRTPTPTPSATMPANSQSSAVQINALRQSVAQTQVTKDRDRQVELLRTLDDASARLIESKPDDAAKELKNAQKIVRDLAKKHAIDGPTYLNWNSRLGVLLATLHASGGNDQFDQYDQFD